MAVQYNCAVQNLGGYPSAQSRQTPLYVSYTGSRVGLFVDGVVNTFISTTSLRSFVEDLGYTSVGTVSVSFQIDPDSDDEINRTVIAPRLEYGDGTIRYHQFNTQVNTRELTNSPLTDVFLLAPRLITLYFDALAPGNTVISSYSHVISIDFSDDIKLRTLDDVVTFFTTTGLSITNNTSSWQATPTILCDEVDNDTGSTVTSTTVTIDDSFETTVTIHTISSGGRCWW